MLMIIGDTSTVVSACHPSVKEVKTGECERTWEESAEVVGEAHMSGGEPRI